MGRPHVQTKRETHPIRVVRSEEHDAGIIQKKAYASEEYQFYGFIFSNIKEDVFSVLYADEKSRPNAPVNSMVSTILLMNRRNWTYKQLFSNMTFHLLVRMALGLDDIGTMPFCPATLYNFQNRLNDHFIKTGVNLLEQVFDQLTEEQLETLKLKTSIQRTDSFAAASNIRNYSRIQLLVELIIRIHRILSEVDKKRFQKQFEPYVNKTSGQYIYTLNASDLPHEIHKLGRMSL